MSAASGRALADPAPARSGEVKPPARWGDLRLRIASAAVLAPVALACVWVGGISWYALVALAGAGACWEWGHMAGRTAPAPVLLLGFGYIGMAILALGWLRADPQTGRMTLLFLLAVVWASDIGAYLAGRLIGGRKLAPAISPGKTWSGAAGGLAAAMAAGAAAAALWHARAAPAMAPAAALGVAAQLGDLLESGVKRHFGVKDSSRLIPGHGGLLDRLDGLMAAAVVASTWLWTVSQGAAIWR